MSSLVREEFALAPTVFNTRTEMGRAAAADIAAELRVRLERQPLVRIIFAAAPSQTEMLEALLDEPGIAWERVEAFHMDEYLGLPEDAPQRFSAYLRRTFFDHVALHSVHLITPGEDAENTAREYATQLAEAPIDMVLCGIGSNGHLAFNDPPAVFEDPQDVKIVELDETCRQQQVDDLCFERVEDVPLRAITLSIPRLLATARIFCCVPGALKREAIRATLEEPISENCPASALRFHAACSLYLDKDSAAALSSQ